MQHCPVCQSEYIKGQIQYCSTCSWDLTPYPLMFHLPEAFVEKERAKLAWAQHMWVQSQRQAKLTQGEVEHLYQEKTQLESQIHNLEEHLYEEKAKWQSQIYKLESKLKSDFESQQADASKYKLQLENIEQEKIKSQANLSQTQAQLKTREQEYSQELSKTQLQYQQVSKRLEDAETLLQLARNSLSHWVPNLNLQLAQEIATIPNKVGAIELLDSLLKSSQHWRHVSQIHKLNLLKAIKSILETQQQDTLDKIQECLFTNAPRNSITHVDAILTLRHELKQKGIIKRDIDGDTLYD